jgi:hypothetical protein
MEEIVIVHRNETPTYQDSIELDIEKGKKIKVYFNASNPSETDERINNAFSALKKAMGKYP